LGGILACVIIAGGEQDSSFWHDSHIFQSAISNQQSAVSNQQFHRQWPISNQQSAISNSSTSPASHS
jgi:hypothetical protein